MRSLSLARKRQHWVLWSGLFLGLSTASLEAQDVRQPGSIRLASHCASSALDCYAPPPVMYPAMPGQPAVPGQPAPPMEPGAEPPPPPGDSTEPAPMPPLDTMADIPGESFAAFDPGQSVAGFGGSFAAANAIGDFIGAPFTFDLVEDGADGIFGTSDDVEFDATSPFSTRTFKIFEGQNARPQDRLFASLGRFSDIGDVDDNNLYRYLVGFERTFLNGRGSFGMQLPFFTVDPTSTSVVGANGQSVGVGQYGLDGDSQSDIGDLTFILKYALYYDECSLDTFSVGVTYTAPTGPDTIADVDTFIDVEFENRGSVQPFAGFLSSLHGNWFAYGFSAIDIPIDTDDTTFWFNDLGIGYYMARPCANWFTAYVPKLEVHVISPIENRLQSFSIRDEETFGVSGPNFSTDPTQDDDSGVLEIHNQVNITAGITLEIRRNTTFTFAYVTPVAGPNPFDHELQFQLQIFGGGARGPLGFGIY